MRSHTWPMGNIKTNLITKIVVIYIDCTIFARVLCYVLLYYVVN